MAHIIDDRVKETTTTTGTGPFALAGTADGDRLFSSRCAVGDTFRGTIQAVDALGRPTGDWQSGTFTYSAADQVTTLVVESSSTGSAVSFGAGIKEVWIGLTATMAGWVRERLAANRTYYVRTDGSDSNTGLGNTAGAAFLTLQKAIDVVAGTLDIPAGIVATIQVGDGTYTSPTVMRTYVGAGTVVIQGNTTTPASCLISTTAATCFSNPSNRYVEFKGFKLQTTTSGFGMTASGGGSQLAYSAINFGACASSHMNVSYNGRLTATAKYFVSGSASTHAEVVEGGAWAPGAREIEFSGTPAFSVAFLYMRNNGMAVANAMTFTGTYASVTGSRYSINLNSTCFVNGGGASYFPGNAAGSAATGGQYA